MSRPDEIWKTKALSQTFLKGVRGAIPLANEQIEVMLGLIEMAKPQVKNFLDLGCGDGILGRSILAKYPEVQGIFLDFSEPMLEAVKSQLNDSSNRLDFILADFGQSNWNEAIQERSSFDVIVSGFAIHHQSDRNKQDIYGKVYELLSPGGIFLNLEHVSSASQWIEKVHDRFFVESLYNFHKAKGSDRSRDEIAESYYHRPDKAANILAPVERQCDWLKTLGFVNVDCYFKLFEIALFGGMRPTAMKANY